MNSIPAAAGGRIEALDIIRGFAVLGIFLVNVPEMVGNGVAFRASYTGVDGVIRLLYDMFVQTKFYSIFSFLFGLGFYLFMQRAERREGRPGRLFGRRLFILLLMGVAHATLFWYGDVLYTYALVGLMLFLFYRREPRTVLIWSLLLSGLFALVVLVSFALAGSVAPEELTKPQFSGLPDLSERVKFLLSDGIGNIFFIGIDVLGLFLLGLYAGKQRWFEQLEHKQPRIARIQWISLAAALVLFIPMVRYYVSSEAYLSLLMYHYTHLAGKALAVFYVCTLLRAIHRFGAASFSGLAAVGRMALTNYLTQTVLTITLVWLFFDSTPDLPLWVDTVYCAVVSAGLIFASRLWLRHYRMGPLEWLWRTGTYGERPALRGGVTQTAPRQEDVGS